MRNYIFLTVLILVVTLYTSGQKPLLQLTFTALDNAAWVQLDSIRIMNRTQGGDATVYWPDTTVSAWVTPGDIMLYVGYATSQSVDIPETGPEVQAFRLSQIRPNPVWESGMFSLFMPDKGTVHVTVTDMAGKNVVTAEQHLDEGSHTFRFTPGRGRLFLLTAMWNGIIRSIKILSAGVDIRSEIAVEYMGSDNREVMLKKGASRMDMVQESGIVDAPDTNQLYVFQFATCIPCPETSTVIYKGRTYNTIQIFSQCWLRENLDAGTMIPGAQGMTDNGILEKYCYNNDTNKCAAYGGLYQWDEMMQYTAQQGARGICPPEWHLPMDEEWKVLEGSVDSQYGIGDPIWDQYGLRGFDAGTNLKSTSGWPGNGNGSGLSGFSGLPGGLRYGDGFFYYLGQHGLWWSSTEGNTTSAWNRYLSYNNPAVDRDYGDNKGFGFNVRCIRDD